MKYVWLALILAGCAGTPVEPEKVDLSGYATTEGVDSAIGELSGDISEIQREIKRNRQWREMREEACPCK